MPIVYAEPIRGWRFLLLNLALGVGNVVVLSNVPGYTILAPYASGNLQGVTPSFGTWATTDHMIGMCLGFPIARWFVARFGDYRTLAVAYALYAALSALCSVSDTIWFFVPARFALGLAGGVILPVGQSLLLGEYPEKLRTVGVGLWGVLSMAPFTVGVFMGGWWAENFGWRSLFYSNIPVALFAAAVVAATFYGRGFKRRKMRFDVVGVTLLAVLLLGVQTIFNQGNDFDWLASPVLATIFVTALVALPCFIVWEMGEKRPAIDVRLFAGRNYAVAMICSLAGFLCIQGILSVFIGQLQLLLGYTSSRAGLVYLTMLLVAAPLVAIVHELCKGVDARLVAFLNFIGFAVVFTWLGLYDKFASFDQITAPMLFFGFMLATFFAPLATIAMSGLQGGRLIRAAEELTLLRTAFGAYGITLMGVVQFRRTPFHQLGLADHFGGWRSISLDAARQFSDKLQANGLTEPMARSQMARLLRQQASLLALDDAFLTAACVFVALAVIVWFAKPTFVRSRKAAPRDEVLELEARELMEQP
jgi:DHA2 family multidrug resistance protein